MPALVDRTIELVSMGFRGEATRLSSLSAPIRTSRLGYHCARDGRTRSVIRFGRRSIPRSH